MTGGTITPGSGTLSIPGTLTINGAFGETGGTFDELIGLTGNGLLDVNGPVTLGGSADLGISLLNGFTLAAGDTFDIMDYLAADGLTGTFANAPTTGFTLDGWNWDINYGFNGDEVLLTVASPVTATPEPSSSLLLVTGLFVLGAFWRRRRAEATR